MPRIMERHVSFPEAGRAVETQWTFRESAGFGQVSEGEAPATPQPQSALRFSVEQQVDTSSDEQEVDTSSE
jgi:hypothetical protein